MNPIWIKKDLIIAVHDELIAEHGGLEGIRDENALESALASPRNLFFYHNSQRSLQELATRYAFSLTSNHAFNDGNKRTAFFACIYFLEQNGMTTNFPKNECFLMMISLSTKKISEIEFVHWLHGKNEK